MGGILADGVGVEPTAGECPVKILIADDDHFIRILLTDLLTDLGHTVVAAANGAEAVELWKREQPDVAVLDFLMPKLSGIDALRAMRADGGRVPAVLLTAISDRSVREVEGENAPTAFLEKPFKRRSLEKAIAKATQTE
jgi:CheY-like chemotaxis protein